MKQLGYILNFSTNYNANNFLYYFLPYISAGNILLYNELTKSPLPANKHFQENKIEQNIRILKDHWDVYRLNPQNAYDSLKINIIIDYKKWHFTGFEDYAHLSFAKIYYIRKIFEQFFHAQDLNKICFQYFILKNKDDEIEELAHYLDYKIGQNDNKGQVNFGPVKRELINWPEWEKFEQLATETINVSGIPMQQKISEKEEILKEEFVEKAKRYFFSGFKVEDKEGVWQEFLEQCFRNFEDDFNSKMITVEDLNNSQKKKSAFEFLFKQLSSAHYLNTNKDLAFRFTINIANNAEKIKSYQALSALISESICFWEQSNPIQFISCGSNLQIMDIEDIVFDDEKLKLLLGRYKGFTFANNIEKKKLSEEKINVKQYDFNASINPQQYFNIDPEMQSRFETVNNLKSQISLFFSKDNVEALQKELNDNSIHALEDQIKANSSKINKMYSLSGDYGMSAKTLNLNLDEIKVQLENLKKEERDNQLSSKVNLEKYETAKNKYSQQIDSIKKDFMDSLRNFPEQAQTHLFFLVSALVVVVLGMPLYSFKDWVAALIFGFVFIALASLAGVIIWFIERSKIIGCYKEIYYANVELFSRFKEYSDSLGTLAMDIRKSTLRRKNILALQQAKDNIVNAQKKHDIYIRYYKDILDQVDSYNNNIEAVQDALSTNINLPPYMDTRNLKGEAFSELEIKSGNAHQQYQNLTTKLGVIKLIKTK